MKRLCPVSSEICQTLYFQTILLLNQKYDLYDKNSVLLLIYLMKYQKMDGHKNLKASIFYKIAFVIKNIFQVAYLNRQSSQSECIHSFDFKQGKKRQKK